MTVEEVQAEVERIRGLVHDSEAAHDAEDMLHRRVLAFIAVSSYDGAAKLAAAAMKTDEIEFERWCA